MRERSVHLDGLRGIAALIVVIVHGIIAFDFALFTGNPQQSHGYWDVVISGFPFILPMAGNYSVCLFFALSGFVLSNSFRHSEFGVLALAVKRTVRLGLPIFFVCLFGWSLLASGLMFNIPAGKLTASQWLSEQMNQKPNLLMALREGAYGNLLGFPDSAAYDAALWTMSIEYFGSLLLIVGFSTFRRFLYNKLILCAFILVIVLIGLAGHALYISLFAFGAALRLCDFRSFTQNRSWLNFLMPFLLILGIFLGTIPYSTARGHVLDIIVSHAWIVPPTTWQAQHTAWRAMQGEDFWHAIGAVLTLIVADNWPPLRRLLSSSITVFLGKISFPLYLVHLPILLSLGCGVFVTLRSFGAAMAVSAVGGAGAFLIAAFLAAWVATLLIEAPVIAFSHRAGLYIQDKITRVSGMLLRYRRHSGVIPPLVP